MGGSVYILGTLVTLACGLLLLRGYQRGRQRLLIWSSVCFFGLALSNALTFIDLVVVPDRNLYRLRLITASVAMCVLLYGLIWEGD